MKERPTLFSGPMVRAILDGRKTQTRRVIKPQPDGCELDRSKFYLGPYGVPGDRLWVRETWWQIPEPSLRQLRDGADTWPKEVAYAADEDDPGTVREWGWKLRPSIFLPRKFSRITLEITDVRVQRLNEISGSDVLSEGIPEQGGNSSDGEYRLQMAFKDLWDSINGKKHPCASNPWVWAITFKRI